MCSSTPLKDKSLLRKHNYTDIQCRLFYKKSLALLASIKSIHYALVFSSQRHSSGILVQVYKNGPQLQTLQKRDNRDNTTCILELPNCEINMGETYSTPRSGHSMPPHILDKSTI